MRILFMLILTLPYMIALSQDQSTKESQKKVNESIDKILLLNKLDDFTTSIYTNSLNCIYLVTDQRSKENLRVQILVELPKIKEQISATNSGIEFTNRLTNLMSSIDSMTSVAKVIMKELAVFEDYVDSTGSYSENYQICKRRIEEVILPKYRLIDAAIEKEISSEEKKLSLVLSEANSAHVKTQIDWSLIEFRYKTLSDKFRFKKLINQLLSGSVNWVYRGYDSVSKDQLIRNVNVDSKELEIRLAGNSESWNIQSQVMTQFLTNSLDTIVVHLQNIMSTLNTEADYEDGMVKLLAEDEIQNGILPRFLSIQYFVEESLMDEIEKMKNSVLELSGKKNNDIRKMLHYNYSTLELMINEAHKSNPQFSIDDLIDAIIPVYSKRFTHEEIKEILRFQNSKVGKKMHKNSESILWETMEVTSNYYKSLPAKKH